MVERISVSVVGASGYTGGELLRLLLFHPAVELRQATSESMAGKPVTRVHPHLRRVTEMRFSAIEQLQPCDLLFLCLPHGQAAAVCGQLRDLAPRLIDLSADFRLRSSEQYERWYGRPHPEPELLEQFVYGLPELNRQEIVGSRYVSGAGCNATATLLALQPLYAAGVVEPGRTVVEVKAGSSQGGARPSRASHHPERSGSVRTYRATGHRHSAEIEQGLGLTAPDRIHLTATAIEMVRGVQSVGHVFLQSDLDEREVWGIYRRAYAGEPFIRLVKERSGVHRLPDPRLLSGTNYCDIGFERDARSNRLVVIAAIDNLMKGAAGQAVQAFNLMHHLDERTGLEFPGLYPS